MIPVSKIDMAPEGASEPPLQEWAQDYLSRHPKELQDKLKALVFGEATDEEAEVREVLLDASTRIDSHAPLGAFAAVGSDGGLVTMRHRHSLLEYRARRLMQQGRLPEAVFAASICDFRGDQLLRDVAEEAIGQEEFSLAQIAIDAMYRYKDFDNPQAVAAQAKLAEAKGKL